MPPQTPSARTPQYSTHNNNADNIERSLHEDGESVWGFVIYRCTYASDADWQAFTNRLQRYIRRTLNIYNGIDMLDSMAFTVMEDKERFDGAEVRDVRGAFVEWVRAQRGEDGGRERNEQWNGRMVSQRYRYCVMVDEEALESILEDEDEEEAVGIRDGFVKVVWKDWEGWKISAGNEGNERDGEEDEEGERQVAGTGGWMMVACQDVMVDLYDLLRDVNAWYTEYRCPPEIARA